MYSKQFWLDAAERSVSTGAQAVLTVWTLDGLDILSADFNPRLIASAFLLGALYALMKSLIASRTGNSESASLIGTKLEEHGR